MNQQRSRIGVAYTVGMISVSFVLTPFILLAEVPKLPGFLLWYSVASGFVGLLGLVGLFVWMRKTSD